MGLSDRQFDALMSAFDELKADNREIKADNKELKADNLELKALIKEQGITIKEQGITIKEQGITIKEQGLLIAQQALEIEKLKDRVDHIEARLDLIDQHLSTIAPLFRHLLEDEESILLDPEYKAIRDEEELDCFYSAHDVIKDSVHYQDLLANFKNTHGLASSFGKRLKDFYVQVLGYSPRIERNYKSAYWLDNEEVLTECVVKSFEQHLLN